MQLKAISLVEESNKTVVLAAVKKQGWVFAAFGRQARRDLSALWLLASILSL